MDEQTARREIVNIGRLLYERSYVVSSDGNVSVRLDDGRIVATPTMICKGRMTEDSLAVTDASGNPLGNRKPSSELLMHLLIYQERPDVMAVCNRKRIFRHTAFAHHRRRGNDPAIVKTDRNVAV